jgi:acetyltransferase-like isoleucine patch superfamily enzyme
VSIINVILKELGEYFSFVLRFCPGKLGRLLRYTVYKKRFKSCGKRVSIPQAVFFKGLENIELGARIAFSPYNSIFAESGSYEASIKIGNNVSFNRNVMINADIKGTIIIEDDVIVGPNVVIRASGHRYENIHKPIREQGHHKGRIVIKAGTWIGANAVILPGVTVGKGAIVAAGAVVTKNLNDFDIVGGVPAKRIGSRLVNRVKGQRGFETRGTKSEPE